MAIRASSRVSSAAGNGKQGHSLISDAKFRQLYELTLRLQAAAAGREAVIAAVAADLRSGDALLAEPSRAESLRLAAPAGAENQSHADFRELAIAAASRAAADRLRGQGSVTVLFVPNHASGEILREAHTIASSAKLPVLFVEQTAPGSNGRARNSADEPDQNQLPTMPVDAEDVIALYRVAHESIARARYGSGPTRIVGTAWPGAGKSETAVEHLESWLEARGLPAQQWRREIEAGLDGKSATRVKSNA